MRRFRAILLLCVTLGAAMPVYGQSSAEQEIKRLEAELQAILPLPGAPFRREGAQFHPLFELSLPKEHWRDSNEGIQPRI